MPSPKSTAFVIPKTSQDSRVRVFIPVIYTATVGDTLR